MSLRDQYNQRLASLGFSPDPAQLRAIVTLDRLRSELATMPSPASAGARLRRRLLGRRASGPPPRGAYLWGGVGRGKTFAMDLFFDSLPFDDKLRFHFHRLMYRVHNRLKSIGHRRDPLQVVAEELAGQARVLCFDEFFVSDIADAMILARLLDALFARQVALVATSNIPPGALYEGGLQRQKFLPAIDLINTHTEIVAVDNGTDYRLRVLERAEIYHSPLDAQAQTNLERYFSEIAPDSGTRDASMEILGRDITMVRRADGIGWFSFEALCEGPRSQADYIEIARCFQTVILSGIPVLDELSEDAARRFVALVDEFYDRRVKLIMSAAAGVDALYQGRRLRREFERTRSRLIEMQSRAYLAAAHVP